jgi:hypothetical protein
LVVVTAPSSRYRTTTGRRRRSTPAHHRPARRPRARRRARRPPARTSTTKSTTTSQRHTSLGRPPRPRRRHPGAHPGRGRRRPQPGRRARPTPWVRWSPTTAGIPMRSGTPVPGWLGTGHHTRPVGRGGRHLGRPDPGLAAQHRLPDGSGGELQRPAVPVPAGTHVAARVGAAEHAGPLGTGGVALITPSPGRCGVLLVTRAVTGHR